MPAYEVMSSSSQPRRLPLDAAYALDGRETLIWRGRGRLANRDVDETTEVLVRWQPDLRVFFRQPDASDALGSLLFEVDETRLMLPELGVDAPVFLSRFSPLEGDLSVISWGDRDHVQNVRFHLANFPHLRLPEPLSETTAPRSATWSGSMIAVGGPWKLRVDTRREIKEITEKLRSESGYAVTHIGELSRNDGSPFAIAELDDALLCLMALFSFARAAWVAPMLPVGKDSRGRAIWWQAGSAFCTAGLGRGVTWLDSNDGEALMEVSSCWMTLWQNELWRQVLRRAVFYYLEANRQGLTDPSFLEVKYSSAQAGLELLAWAILEQDGATSATSGAWRSRGHRAAEGNLRELLMWAGIPTRVPRELPALEELRLTNRWQDAAPILPWLRNQVAHPRLRGGQFGPDRKVVRQGWQLACWYLELILLRRLGFRGHYGNRLNFGRWIGDTDPVPWREH